MALIFETIKYRHKQDKDLVITVLNIKAEDEDYREPAYIYKHLNYMENWQVSLNHNFLDEYEQENM